MFGVRAALLPAELESGVCTLVWPEKKALACLPHQHFGFITSEPVSHVYVVYLSTLSPLKLNWNLSALQKLSAHRRLGIFACLFLIYCVFSPQFCDLRTWDTAQQ